jgi:hypothetical protein
LGSAHLTSPARLAIEPQATGHFLPSAWRLIRPARPAQQFPSSCAPKHHANACRSRPWPPPASRPRPSRSVRAHAQDLPCAAAGVAAPCASERSPSVLSSSGKSPRRDSKNLKPPAVRLFLFPRWTPHQRQPPLAADRTCHRLLENLSGTGHLSNTQAPVSAASSTTPHRRPPSADACRRR